jgi:hypothetical protein
MEQKKGGITESPDKKDKRGEKEETCLKWYSLPKGFTTLVTMQSFKYINNKSINNQVCPYRSLLEYPET